MSIKASGWSGLLALMLLARAAYAQVDVEALPNVDSLDEAAKRVEVAHCNRPACRSIALIDQAVQLQIAGAAATVGRPRTILRDRDVRVATAFRKLVEQGRRLKPELCRQAATLLSGYGTPGVASEVVVPVAVLDLTSSLDIGGTAPGCTRALIRAMPASSIADIAIRNAHALCAAQGGGGRCADIAR